MKLTILATPNQVTDPNYTALTEQNIKDLGKFSGSMASICYLNSNYFDPKYTDDKKALARFERVASTGHHSISDHAFVTVLFENIPKMTAMILNSVGFYNTSEKSGRYTVMNGDEETHKKYFKNYELYEKWKEIFNDAIATYAEKWNIPINDKLREKLTLENARYVLSVFAPTTTMAYTTSLRMWSYIRQWCKSYIGVWDDGGASLDLKRTPFNSKLLDCITELYNTITEARLYSECIVEQKGWKFRFLAKQTCYDIDKAKEHYDDVYLIKYRSSFADLAQQQRHRTLHHYMCFEGTSNPQFYVPKILQYSEPVIQEWKNDLDKVKETYPIATMVDVVETGDICDFMSKCDERLCGRVQLETFETIKNNLFRFTRHWDKSNYMLGQLKRHFRDGELQMKCNNIHCNEPCIWGPIKAQTRLV